MYLNWRKRLIAALQSAAVLASAGLLALTPTTAAHADIACHPGMILSIVARGATAGLEPRQQEGVEFEDRLGAALGGMLYGKLELGNIDGDKRVDPSSEYPASGPISWNSNYISSINVGTTELVNYLNNRVAMCSGETYVLAGYSAGAHLVGNALFGLSANAINHIGYVALYGDPRRYGCGWWQRGSAGCTQGLLSGRDPYIPAPLRGRVGSWCDDGDYMCHNTQLGLGTHAAAYKGANGWIAASMYEVKNQTTLKQHELNPPTQPEAQTLAIIAQPSGEQNIFWRSADGDLYEMWFNNGWHGPVSLGMGHMGSAPTAAYMPTTNEQHVFWKSPQGQLIHTWYDGTWHTPYILNTDILGSQPAALAYDNKVVVFWQSPTGNLMVKWWDGSQWNGPGDLGPMNTLGHSAAPAVAVNAQGEQIVFWKGIDGKLWEKWFSGGQWHGPGQVTQCGTLGSAPTVAIKPTNNAQLVFYKGTDGNLYECGWLNGWFGPYNLGMGALGSAPSAAAPGTAEVVFWRGHNGALWEGFYTDNWYGPGQVWGGYIPPQ